MRASLPGKFIFPLSELPPIDDNAAFIRQQVLAITGYCPAEFSWKTLRDV